MSLPRLCLTLLVYIGTFAFATHVEAQSTRSLRPLLGIGFVPTLTTGDHILGLGFHARGSAPINADLSFTVDVGFTGFILEGRDEAIYALQPQIALVITINAQNPKSPYVLGGVGGYIPLGSNADDNVAGPTLHGGIGFARTLSNTSIYIEVNPALVIEQSSVSLMIPVRFGVVL